MTSSSGFAVVRLIVIGCFLVAVRSSESTEPSDKTAPITIRGHAKGPEGKPLQGATINLCIGRLQSSPRRSQLTLPGTIDPPKPSGDPNKSASSPNWKIIATATIGADGRYEFKEIHLPLSPSRRMSDKILNGGFFLFGTAAGYGFAWSGTRDYWDVEKPSDAGSVPGDKRVRQGHVDFYRGEPIDIDLEFTRATSLKGRVIDEDSRPLGGAKVLLSNADYLNGDGKALDVHTRQFVTMRDVLPLDECQAETGADGRFEIGGLPAEACFDVNVEHAGFAKSFFHAGTTSRAVAVHQYIRAVTAIRGNIDVEIPRRGKQELRIGEITVRLHPLHTVLVDVVEEDSGRPVVNARVFVVDPTQDRSGDGTTDANGRAVLKLAMVQYRLAADPPPASLYIRSQPLLDGIAGRDKEPFTIQVAKGCVVNFEVVDADSGEGIAGIGFEAEELSKPPEKDRELLIVNNTTGWFNRPFTDTKDGKLSVVMKPGRYRFISSPQIFGLRNLKDEYEVGGWSPETVLASGESVELKFALKRKSAPAKDGKKPAAETAPRQSSNTHLSYVATASCCSSRSKPNSPWRKSMRTMLPSGNSPLRISVASGFCTCCWITRFSGRAPKVGS